MHWKLNLLPLGFLLIVLGSVVILTSNNLLENSVFFIFPFFFIGPADSFGIGLPMVLMLVFFIVAMGLALMYVSKMNIQPSTGVQDSFIQVGSRCLHCSRPIPIGSSFCPFCGSPVSQNDDLNEYV